MKQEIITYLAGPRNFIQGVELYEKYGINRMLKKSFRRQGETETMKAILLEELRKLAGLSEREFKTIRRNSKQPAAVKMEPARQEPPKMPVKYSDDLLLELAESFGVSVEELVSSDFRDKVLSMDEKCRPCGRAGRGTGRGGETIQGGSGNRNQNDTFPREIYLPELSGLSRHSENTCFRHVHRIREV